MHGNDWVAWSLEMEGLARKMHFALRQFVAWLEKWGQEASAVLHLALPTFTSARRQAQREPARQQVRAARLRTSAHF